MYFLSTSFSLCCSSLEYDKICIHLLCLLSFSQIQGVQDHRGGRSQVPSNIWRREKGTFLCASLPSLVHSRENHKSLAVALSICRVHICYVSAKLPESGRTGEAHAVFVCSVSETKEAVHLFHSTSPETHEASLWGTLLILPGTASSGGRRLAKTLKHFK